MAGEGKKQASAALDPLLEKVVSRARKGAEQALKPTVRICM